VRHTDPQQCSRLHLHPRCVSSHETVSPQHVVAAPKLLPISAGQGVGPGSLSLCLPLRRRQEGGRTPFLCSGLVVRIRFCFLWRVVGMVGAVSRRINLPQLFSHIGDDLQGDVSEYMAIYVDRSVKTATWSSRRSFDLVRSVSRCVVVVRGYP
jgi:hypothetical protein